MPDTHASGGDLLYGVEEGIGTIVFNRPQARNALTFPMYEQLAAICGRIGSGEESVKALVLTGAGEKAFAAGTDISQFRSFGSPQDAIGYEARIDRVLGAWSVARCPRSPRSRAPARAEAPGSPLAATSVSAPPTPSAFRSPARSGIASPWPITPDCPR